MSTRITITLVANAVAWAMLLHAPWTLGLSPASIALIAVHVLYPLLAPSRALPLFVGLVDAAALYAAYHYEVWGRLTVVVVPVLAGIAVIALAYASAIVLFLHRRQARRRPPA